MRKLTTEEFIDKAKTVHGVKILYFSNLGIEYPYEVFEKKEDLLKEIRKIA